MILKFKKQAIYLASVVFATLSLASCAGDEIKPSEDEKVPAGQVGMECEGFELGFAVALNEEIADGVAEVENYDDYVETKDHFRVFFFDKDGRFLFNAIDRTVTPLGSDDLGRKKFYVRIPMNYIVDRENYQYDANEIKEFLRNNPFKVAVLANWPNTDGTDDIKGEPHWGWKESFFNPGSTDVKNINDLHHLTNRITPVNEEIYDFLMDENKSMGITKDWVEEREGKNYGKKLGENSLIPMYGVQNFAEIGDWIEGTTYDLSGTADTDDNESKNIYLLRSVAKIEVYFNFEPEYVKVVNMNRTARCEPKDVETPTDKIWDKTNTVHTGKIYNPNQNLDNLCEWFKIGNHDVYKTGEDYKSWLAWFYGTWKTASWFVDETSDLMKGWDFKSVTVPETDKDSKGNLVYPHIFNADYNPVEAYLIYDENTTDDVYKYVIYMPEKFMADPEWDDSGNIKETDGKISYSIPYVELKTKPEDGNEGGVYRFYFSDDKPKSMSDEDLLASHLWPIMRNHIYRIYVSDIEDTTPKIPTLLEVRARVIDWNYTHITNEW